MNFPYGRLIHPFRTQLTDDDHPAWTLELNDLSFGSHILVFPRHDGAKGGDNFMAQHVILQKLCTQLGVNPPDQAARQFIISQNGFALQWLCFAEYATYTLVAPLTNDVIHAIETQDFESVNLLKQLPMQWLFELQGKVLAGAHFLVLQELSQNLHASFLKVEDDARNAEGYEMPDGSVCWTDFLRNDAHFAKYLFQHPGLSVEELTKKIRTFLDVSDLHHLSMLAPLYFEKSQAILNGIEGEIATLSSAMANAPFFAGEDRLADAEQNLFRQVNSLHSRLRKFYGEFGVRLRASIEYQNHAVNRVWDLALSPAPGSTGNSSDFTQKMSAASVQAQGILARYDSMNSTISSVEALYRTRIATLNEKQSHLQIQLLDIQTDLFYRIEKLIRLLCLIAMSVLAFELASGFIGVIGRYFHTNEAQLFLDVGLWMVWLACTMVAYRIIKKFARQALSKSLSPKEEAPVRELPSGGAPTLISESFDEDSLVKHTDKMHY